MITKKQADTIASEFLMALKRKNKTKGSRSKLLFIFMVGGFVLGGAFNYWLDRTIFFGGLVGGVLIVILCSGINVIFRLRKMNKNIEQTFDATLPASDAAVK